MDGGLKIGELAHRAGVTAKAIRFYERKGILPTARRAANRYRVYGEDVADVLCFIKQASGLGLTLAEIKDIIAIRQGGRPPCKRVKVVFDPGRTSAVKVQTRITQAGYEVLP